MDNIIEEYLARISEDWGNLSESSICFKIVTFIFQDYSKNVSSLTYQRLAQIAASGENNAALLRSIQYLCGDRVPVLEMKFELFDNNNHYQISAAEIKEAETTNYLIHPNTGEIFEDYKDKVLIYYSPVQSYAQSSG